MPRAPRRLRRPPQADALPAAVVLGLPPPAAHRRDLRYSSKIVMVIIGTIIIIIIMIVTIFIIEIFGRLFVGGRVIQVGSTAPP